MPAYYNEIDPFAAEWLRKLIENGHIAPGDVDTRSIEDVAPDDLKGYKQCHFFAGIGVWSHSLRLAGWPDNKPIWTGSCPCQPFSSAGKGAGFDDERHLWPSFHWLIEQCKPSVIAGEQVAAKNAEPWIDLVQADLEALGYSFGCVPFPSAGVGAPHIRDRAYWVADASSPGLSKFCRDERKSQPKRFTKNCAPLRMANANSGGPKPWSERSSTARQGNTVDPNGSIERLADTKSERRDRGESATGATGRVEPKTNGAIIRPGPVNGFWGNADWLSCRDGKWRPVESGTFPLVNGAANRVGRLRGYGNAINAQAAKIFIEAVVESL